MWRRVLRGVKGFNLRVGVCAHSPASRVQHAQACLFVWKGGRVLGGAWQTQSTLFFCTCVRHFPVAADVEGVQPPARGERTKEQRATAPLTCSVGSACPTPRLQKNSKGNAVSRGRTRACDLGAADGERTQQAAAVATRWRISARIAQSGGPWKVAYGNTCGRRQIADVKRCAGNKGVGHGRRGQPAASSASCRTCHRIHIYAFVFSASFDGSTCSPCSSKRTPRTSLSSASAPGAHASKKSAPATPNASRGEHCASGARFCAECAGKPQRCTGKQSLTSQNLPPSSCSKNASPAPPQPLTSRSVRACNQRAYCVENSTKRLVSPCSAIPKQSQLLGT